MHFWVNLRLHVDSAVFSKAHRLATDDHIFLLILYGLAFVIPQYTVR